MALERLLRFQPGEWVLPLGLVVVLLSLGLGGPGTIEALRYERSAVLGGEAWRLVTGHLVHGDAAHLGWNIVGVLVVWLLFARDFSPRQWLVVMAASTVTASLGFLLLEPDLEWYVGFSGVLHGCMAAGLLGWLRSARDPITWFVTGLFVAKLAWEHVAGPLPFTAASMSLPVVHEAHSYGALGGVLAALWLLRRPRTRDAPL